MIWLDHVLARIDRVHVDYDPFSHIIVPDVFPKKFYRNLLLHRPEGALLNPEKPHRFIFYPGADIDPFWDEFRRVLCGDELRDKLTSKFGVKGSTSKVCILHDYPGNALGPHTDTPNQTVTGLFYLPDTKAHAAFGTALIHSKSGRTCAGSEDHAWDDDFEIVKIAPYAPNSALFFCTTNCSWHAAIETKAERWLVDYHIE